MTEQTIRLERGEWRFDPSQPLGEAGGFGEVFRGWGSSGEVAVKRLKVTADAAAHRELKIGARLADGALEHVVPVLDFGQDAETDRYFLIMPLCDESLHAKLRREGPMSYSEAREIILQIAAGLAEVQDIVHRDLKPSNVLFHEGRWKIADFGIAKFVEDATSLQSLRNSLTPSYAAPEQWAGERPQPATDIYALACIMYALIEGRPPFSGDQDAVREAHLSKTPAPLEGVPPRVSALGCTMLRKSMGARPSLARCRAVLEAEVGEERPRAKNALFAAAQAVASAEAAAEAEATRVRRIREGQASLMMEAINDLQENMDRLFAEVQDASDSVQREARWIRLGHGQLVVGEVHATPSGNVDQPSMPQSQWDAICGTTLELRQNTPVNGEMYTWSVTLLYARRPEEEDYRWYELGFWTMGRKQRPEPCSIRPGDREIDIALSRIMGAWNLAVGPTPIDAEDEEAFHHRYLTLLSRAAVGRLHWPNQMPVPPQFFD